MRSDDEAVETLRRAHRDATDRLDDAPDARVRAAVLAAAARGVDARPPLATSASIVAHPFRTRRWPLSAAALLVVSVMTGLVATHVMRDSPERVTTIASSAPPVDASKPEAAGPRDAVSEPPRTDTAGSPPAAPRSQAAPASSKRAVAASASPSGGQRADGDRTPTPKSLPEPPPVPAQLPSPSRSAFVAPPAAAPAPDPANSAKTANTAENAVTAGAPVDPSSRDGERRFAAEAARTVTPATRARVGRTAEPATPEAWVERIAQLRAAGNDAEADRELDGLRRRYPGFAIPANALATGDMR